MWRSDGGSEPGLEDGGNEGGVASVDASLHERNPDSSTEGAPVRAGAAVKGPTARTSRRRWTKRFFAGLSVAALILAAEFVGAPPVNETCDLTDLPCTFNYSSSSDVTVTLQNIDAVEAISIYVLMSKEGSWDSWLSLEEFGSNGTLGYVYEGENVFTFDLRDATSLNPKLHFFARDTLNVTIDQIGDDGSVPVDETDFWWQGRLYPEEYPKPGSPPTGYRALVAPSQAARLGWNISAADNHTGNEDIFYSTIVGGDVASFGKFDGGSMDLSVTPGASHLKLYADNLTWYKAYVYGRGALDVVAIPVLNNVRFGFVEDYGSPPVNVDPIAVPSNLTEGDVVWVRVAVQNWGESAVSGIAVEVHLDTIGDANASIGRNFVTLDPKETAVMSFSWNTTGTFGNHWLRAVLDADASVDEYDENNVASESVVVSNSNLSDSDNDTLPDRWEWRYGLDANSSAGDNGTSGDPDNDGLNNSQEYAGATDPASPHSDRDRLEDGPTNDLIWLNLTSFVKNGAQLFPDAYYLWMYRVRMSDGSIFPYSGFRVPETGYFAQFTSGPPIPLSLSYFVHEVPIDVYHATQSDPDPMATFYVTVDKSQLSPGNPIDLVLGAPLTSPLTLAVRAEGLFDAFADPDPLLNDADADSLVDPFEIVYENTRYLDYRGQNPDLDGMDNLVDTDSDDDNATDGRELRLGEYESYDYDAYEYPLNFSLGGDIRTYPEFAVNRSTLAAATLSDITDPYAPDVDGEGLLDGDEINRYRTDPHAASTDDDSQSDWVEVNQWVVYRNATISEKFFDLHGSASVDMSLAPSFWWFPSRPYEVELHATAAVNTSSSSWLDTAIDVTLWTDGPEPITYTADYETPGSGGGNTSVIYNLTLEVWPYADRLEFEANDTAFVEPHRFDLVLAYAVITTQGTDPTNADVDWDGLEDPDEASYGLTPWLSDYDADGIWDAGELAYWQDYKGTNFDTALARAKTFDVDSDRLGDGYEVYLAIDPTDPDPDHDGLTDYGEVFEFVPMYRAAMNASRVNTGSFVHAFTPTSSDGLPSDEYRVKFLAEGSLNRSWSAYSSEDLRDNYSVAAANDAWLASRFNFTAIQSGTNLTARVIVAGSTVNEFANVSGGINATGNWFFSGQYRLKQSGVEEAEFNLTLNVSGATLYLRVTEFVALRQGVNPWTDDYDGEGLKDGDEVNLTANPYNTDTDGDEVDDYEEFSGSPRTDLLAVDTDGDGLWDGPDVGVHDGEAEPTWNTSAVNPDTDDDGLWDGWNITVDGVLHLGEKAFGTDPLDWDTDGDSIPDGWEAERGLNPLYDDAASDTDQDGLNNSQEYVVDTWPLDNDTDDDGLEDGDEIYTVIFRTSAAKGAVNASAYGTAGQWVFLNVTAAERFMLASWLDGSELVSGATGNQTNASISGNIVVWQDDRNAVSTGWDVYGYNISAGTEFLITNAAGNQTNPGVWGDVVVWQNDSAGNWDISAYNLSSGERLTLANHTADQVDPAIQGSLVLWADKRYGNSSNGWQWDIVGYDLTRGFEVRVTEEAFNASNPLLPNQTKPSLWSGSAAWLDDRFHASDVVLHSPSNDTVLTNDSATRGRVRIAGRWVAWDEMRTGESWDVVLYDTQTGNATLVTQDASDQKDPFLTERYLLWTDWRNGTADVWAYDLETGVAFVLANGSSEQSRSAAWGDRFVFAASGGAALDVRMWNLTRVLSLRQGEPVFDDGEDLWIWRANGTGFRFAPSTDSGILTSDRPVHAFRDREFHAGTDPFHPDTDRDGLVDGVSVTTQNTTSLFQNFTALGLRYVVDGLDVVFRGEATVGTDPLIADTDADALKDGDEVYGYTVKVVLANGTAFERENVTTDPMDPDVDNDALPDGVELAYQTDPEDADTDADGLIDGYNATYDENGPEKTQIGLEGGWVCVQEGGYVTYCGELTYGASPTNNESDGDRISDHDEVFTYNIKLNPARSDTDGDGMPDGFELFYYNYTFGEAGEIDPLDGSDADADSDNDGASNVHEYWARTNATRNDTDWDGLPDGWEIECGLDPLAGLSDTGNGSGMRYRLKDDWTHETYWPGDADQNGTGDPDADGMDNAEEYSYGRPLDWSLDDSGPWWSGLDPLRPDTDADGANDSAEANPKAWWSQAEAYPFDETQVVNDSAASKGAAVVNKTSSEEILDGEAYARVLPAGTYRIMFRARSVSSDFNVTVRATKTSVELLDVSYALGATYAWYVTSAFSLSAGDKLRVWFNDSADTRPSIRVDAFLIVAIGTADIDVTLTGKAELSGSASADATFEIDLPEGFVLYAVSANLTLTPEQNVTWPSDAKLWVGDNSGPLYQWNHTEGSFSQASYVLDISGEVNKYLAAHGGGGVSVPLTFDSATKGNISYTLYLYLLPFLSDPTVPDTDGDLLPDGVEAALNGSSFRWDSDNDTLPDAVEPFAGTNLSDSDTDDDVWVNRWGDGDPVELRTLFRTNATDGENYTVSEVWLSLDPFPENTTYTLFRYRWTGLEVDDSDIFENTSLYERITFIGTKGNAANASSPEGFDVWRNKTGEPTRVWLNVSGTKMAVFDRITPQPAPSNETVAWQPQPSFAVEKRETYRNRANFTDDDYDGLSKAKEYGLGTSWSDPDSDQGGGDGLLDGYNITTGTGTYLFGYFDDQSPSIVRVPAGDGMVTFLGELSLGTDPTKRDTDGDGVIDGDELDGVGPATDPLNPDTDGDRLLDGLVDYVTATGNSIALFVSLWIVRLAGTDRFLGEGVSPDNGSALDADTDDDGIPDGWERRFALNPKAASDADGDADGDGLTNAYEYTLGTLPKNGSYSSAGGSVSADNSDADSFSGKDRWEDASGLDPMTSGSQDCELLPNYTRECKAGGLAREGATGDPDSDGLANSAEASEGTSATNADSDGDWLLDGADRWVSLASTEFKAWIEKRIPYRIDAGQARFYGEDHDAWTPIWTTDPLNPDTDGDGIGDGQEVYGYKVTISWYVGEDLKSQEKTMTGHPQYEYKSLSSSPQWLDTDGDGILDIWEANPRRTTGPTRPDEVIHFVEKYGSNESLMTSQFNPLIKENLPPTIESFRVDSMTTWATCWAGFIPYPCVTHAWTQVEVQAFDVSPYTLTITVLDNGRARTFSGQGLRTFKAAIDVDFWSDILLDYTVRTRVVDTADNAVVLDKKVNGVIGGFIQLLKDIWDAIAGAFAAAVSLVQRAISFLLDLIVGLMKAILDVALAPLWDAANDWAQGLHRAIERIMTVGDTDDIDRELLWQTALVGGFITFLYVLAIALIYVIEPLLIAALYIIPGMAAVMPIVSKAIGEAVRQTALGLLAFAFATAAVTLGAMVGEILAALIPHDHWAQALVTGWGTSWIGIVSFVAQKFVMEIAISWGDVAGFILTTAGLFAVLFSTAFGDWADEMAILGALFAVAGLVISWASPDLPELPGFLDEGVQSVMAGWAVYDALN